MLMTAPVAIRVEAAIRQELSRQAMAENEDMTEGLRTDQDKLDLEGHEMQELYAEMDAQMLALARS